MKKNLALITCLLAVTITYAQKQSSYDQKAAAIRKEIWEDKLPGFDLKDAPDSLKNESAVILARSYEVSRTSGLRVKYMIITAGAATRTTRITTFHERVKINDKSALSDYSSIEYQKRLNETKSALIARMLDVHETYVGVKILKPDGKEVIINTNEEVLLKDQQKDKLGKLAISGLEVGDVIDYYISTSDVKETATDDNPFDNRYVVFLSGEHPILNFNLSFQYNSKIDVKTVYGNGAPQLTESVEKDGDKFYKLQLKNLPKHKAEMWTSRYRQFPYLIISSTYSSYSTGGTKQLNTKTSSSELLESRFSNYFNELYYYFNDKLEKAVKEEFGGIKKFKAAPLDSSMKFLYNKWKHDVFCYYDGKEMDMSNERNGRSAYYGVNAAYLSKSLEKLGVSHDIIAGTSRYSGSMENLDGLSPIEVMIRVNGAKPIYMSISDVVSPFNQIPQELDGEKVIVFTPTKKNARVTTFASKEEILPASTPDQNYSKENISVAFQPDNLQKLNISRNVKMGGQLGHFDQLRLLLMENIDKELTQITKGETIEKRLKSSSLTKKMQDDYQAAFEKARTDTKQNFVDEIKEQFEIEPQQVKDYKVINSGLNTMGGYFEFASSFTFENLVKKAGLNYILDAGKLIGTYAKLDDEQRKRSIDIFMPYARSFNYNIAISIPKGYTVKGLEQLTSEIKNPTGSFSSTARVEGDILKLTINRTYEHNFEKVSEWPKLVELIDAVNNYTNQKVLLEKTL